MLDHTDTRGRLLTDPSAIWGLRSELRSWDRALGPFIFAALYSNTDIYNNVIDKQNEQAVPADEEVTLDDGTLSRPARRGREVRDTCAPCYHHHD